MPPNTDDLRIRSFAPLSHAGRATARAAVHGADVRHRRERAARIASHPARRGRPARGRDRPVLDPRPEGRDGIRAAPAAAARHARRRARDRHARVFREAAHDGRLEGAHQRSRSRRQLQHQQGPCGSAAACSATSTRSACRPASSTSTRSRRNTSRTSSRGARSARARPRAKCIASWLRACRARSASRTARTATSRLRSTPSARRRIRIISWP